MPTGNFGDIFAGYVAKRMGLPIRRLILATNDNDILTRFVNDGEYAIGDVVSPPSRPSMDIQVASNFERYLYYLYGQDPLRVRNAFAEFARSGRMTFAADEQRQVTSEFHSLSVNDASIIDEIRGFHAANGYVLDPHTAVGVRAGRSLATSDVPMICLATAHAAKFPEAVHQAIGRNPERPVSLDGLEERPRRCETIDAEISVIKEFVERHAL